MHSCTTCEESFELNFRGSIEQLFVVADGYYQTPSLGDTVRKNSSFFSFSYVSKRSEDDAEMCKIERDV